MIDSYFEHLKNTFDLVKKEDIKEVADTIHYCMGNIFVFGNGGSASTAAHFVQDMNKNTKYKFICLNDNIPTMLAYANDCGYPCIFREQLAKLIKIGDMVIGISCSGNSPNVLKAIEYANNIGCVTIGFCGFDGGELRKITDTGVYVPSNDMQVCEDIHLIVSHIILRMLK
jgi:D-sedoheptulose 7-phosphate isomerase